MHRRQIIEMSVDCRKCQCACIEDIIIDYRMEDMDYRNVSKCQCACIEDIDYIDKTCQCMHVHACIEDIEMSVCMYRRHRLYR